VGGTPVPGATSTSFVPRSEDVGYGLKVVLTLTDSKGNAATIDSNSVTVTLAAVVDNPATGQPQILANGITASASMPVGTVLVADHGSLSDIDGINVSLINYEWWYASDSSPFNTGGSYTTTASDVGKVISLKASFMDNKGNSYYKLSSNTVTIEGVVDNTPVLAMPTVTLSMEGTYLVATITAPVYTKGTDTLDTIWYEVHKDAIGEGGTMMANPRMTKAAMNNGIVFGSINYVNTTQATLNDNAPNIVKFYDVNPGSGPWIVRIVYNSTNGAQAGWALASITV
jgi:hypothetical protein